MSAILGAGHTVSKPGSNPSSSVSAPVLNRNLEVHRSAFRAGVDEPHLPIVVLRQAPGSAVGCGRLAKDPVRCPPEAERVVGAVDPVVEPPHEAALLVLDVSVTADADPRIEDLLLVRHAVVVRVPVADDIVRVGLVDEDAVVVERDDHAREHDLVDEDGVLVVHAVASGALPARDAVGRFVLGRRIRVAHVTPELRDVHPTVAVPFEDRRVVDVGVSGDQLHAVPGGQQEGFRLLLRRSWLKRRLCGEVGTRVVLAARSGATTVPPCAAGSARRLGRRRL